MEQIIALKIKLNNTHPLIWRRILVPASIHFFDLHHILQISMGWQRLHLFEFIVNGDTIGYINPAQAFEDLVDAKEVTLDYLLLRPGFVFTYLYAFGEHWEHLVEVENLLKKEEGHQYPVCVDGYGACPPDDCGGVEGYYKLHTSLEVDSEKFDLKKINEELQKFKSYMKDWG